MKQLLTIKYSTTGIVTVDGTQFSIKNQDVLDSTIQCNPAIKAAVERLYEYEEAEEKGLIEVIKLMEDYPRTKRNCFKQDRAV